MSFMSTYVDTSLCYCICFCKYCLTWVTAVKYVNIVMADVVCLAIFVLQHVFKRCNDAIF